jgi:hypothetical protein
MVGIPILVVLILLEVLRRCAAAAFAGRFLSTALW